MAKCSLNASGTAVKSFSVWVSGTLRVKKRTQKQLAEYIGLDVSNVSRRIHGDAEWTLREFYLAQEFLEEEFHK